MTITPIMLLTFCSFLLNHVDRRYLRENGRLFGSKYSNNLSVIFTYVISQINNIFEFITGFTDGLLKKQQYFVVQIKEIEKPTIIEKIVYVYQTIQPEQQTIQPEQQPEQLEKSKLIDEFNETNGTNKINETNETKIPTIDDQTYCTKYVTTNKVFDLFEKITTNQSVGSIGSGNQTNQSNQTNPTKPNLFFEDALNDEKTIIDIKNKISNKGKKLNIKIIPKHKNKKKT